MKSHFVHQFILSGYDIQQNQTGRIGDESGKVNFNWV